MQFDSNKYFVSEFCVGVFLHCMQSGHSGLHLYWLLSCSISYATHCFGESSTSHLAATSHVRKCSHPPTCSLTIDCTSSKEAKAEAAAKVVIVFVGFPLVLDIRLALLFCVFCQWKALHHLWSMDPAQHILTSARVVLYFNSYTL